jgi:putative membrane protein
MDERKVSNYGVGIAPYFLSLAFFAGALIYSNTFPIRGSYDAEAYGFRLFVSKILSYGLMAVVQALIAGTIVIYGLKMPVQSVPMFDLYTAIVSLAFMFLVQMLVTWLERPGQFIALVLLILQLVCSAGTFPYELLPAWAQALHPWLPMSYSVAGYREVISAGSYDEMWSHAAILLAILAASIALIGLFYWLQGRRSKKNRPLYAA